MSVRPAVTDSLSRAVALMDELWKFGGWESVQTHESLRRYLVEETYELLDAIDRGDAETIREELGDLLLQVLFHSRIAESAGQFTIGEVAATLVNKLVGRSPHLANSCDISPDISVTAKIAAQERAWRAAKAREKARESCLDGIATAQPALALAEKILARATAAGLPADLIPHNLRTIELGADAEGRLRAAATDFSHTIRAAEDAAFTARGRRENLTAPDWRKYWPHQPPTRPDDAECP